jgi:polysaccharide export outer membrane protein
MNNRILSLCLLLAAALPFQAAAQPPTSTSPGDYRLGAGDVIDVKVFGVDELSQTVRVSASGAVTLPLLGLFEASGLSVRELEEQIKAKLVQQRLVKDPQVTLFVKEYKSQPVYVLGAVNKPGQYMITSQLRLVDAISLSGGFDLAKAGDTITVKHQSASNTAAESASSQTQTISVKQLMEHSDPALNITLQAGDIVQVAERKSEVFYVVGDVGKPGVIEFPRDRSGGLLLSQAVVWAGGPTKTAKTKAGLLVRRGPDGKRQQFAVDFKAIIEGKKPDQAVLPGDVIYIPGSGAKSLRQAFTQAIPWAVSNGLVFAVL